MWTFKQVSVVFNIEKALLDFYALKVAEKLWFIAERKEDKLDQKPYRNRAPVILGTDNSV